MNAQMRPLEVVYQFILGKKRKKNCKDKDKAHLSPAAAFNFPRFETDVKNIMIISLISRLSVETRNSVGMARLVEAIRRVSG